MKVTTETQRAQRTLGILSLCTLCLCGGFPLPASDWVTQLGGRLEHNQAGQVTGVVLRGSWVSDGDLDALRGLPQLARLDLSLTRITDLGMLRLKDLPNITELNLFYAEHVTDEGVAAIKGWKKLARLNLRGTKITDNTLSMLAGMPTLTALDAGFAEITDSGLQHLAALTGLRELAVGGNKLNEVGLQVLRSLPGLTHLDLSGRQRTDSGLWFVSVTDLGLDTVASLVNLRELNLSGTLVSARGLAKLAGLKQLEKLDLHGAKRVGDDAPLNSLPRLRWVDLKDTTVSAQGAAALRKQMPQATIEWE